MYVFVYGTLKKNEPNYHWLTNEDNGHARFVSTGKTKRLFPLVIASKYNIPFLLDSPDIGKNVHGEIYEIDEKMLANLDILEEYPKLYTRRPEDIIVTDDNSSTNSFKESKTDTDDDEKVTPTNKSEAGSIIAAWTYFLHSFKSDMLQRPQLDNYSATGSHNLHYVARYLRDKAVDHRLEVKLALH